MECAFFCPADFSFVCPIELENLAEKYAQFREIGCEVYSVSTDAYFVHKARHDASDRMKKINYPMLADPTHCISKELKEYVDALATMTDKLTVEVFICFGNV